jgi:hypothetical protein
MTTDLDLKHWNEFLGVNEGKDDNELMDTALLNNESNLEGQLLDINQRLVSLEAKFNHYLENTDGI